MDWALTISDPAQRRSGLEAALQKWRESDPEAANSYLKGKVESPSPMDALGVL